MVCFFLGGILKVFLKDVYNMAHLGLALFP